MMTLREFIAEAEEKKVAIGHFNISDSEQLHAIFNAAKELSVPVIIGTSEGERNFIGVRQAVALIQSLREEHDFPIFLNADHTYSFEKVREVIDAGYDAIVFDGIKLSFEENIEVTKKCVAYARDCGRDVVVEGELGFIGTSSKLLDEIPEGVHITREHMTKPEELKQYIEETGIDLVAPAVGNLHGKLKHGKNPNLDAELITELRKKGEVPMVLHGGSGVTDEGFVSAIKAGIAIVHINTDIRVAYRKGIQLGLQENMEEIAPYKYMKEAVLSVQKVVKERLKLFNNM